jgi:PAS domain S-box-containing protein
MMQNGKEAERVLMELKEDEALKAILEGTARVTGEHFFEALVTNLAKALNTHGAWVTEYLPEKHLFRAIAFWLGGQMFRNYEMKIEGSPCEVVLQKLQLVHYRDDVQELFGNDKDVQDIGAVSYMGVPLLDANGEVLGHMAVVDRNPMPAKPRFQATFEIFAARAAAELQRLRAESGVREREEKLRRLINSAMDAIIELDQDLSIKGMNLAAEKVFACKSRDAIGSNIMKFLTPDSCRKVNLLTHDLHTRPEGEQYLWIPGNLEAVRPDGKTFPAEASISRYEAHRNTYYTLILRNVNERIQAERTIQSLTVEAEYLREEIEALQNFGEVIGESKELRRALREVHQVAPTDSTVLLLGETGTGKELFARAIHSAGSRKDKPLLKVNCAAIPPSLMESEFFGHEAGAFTGALKKREGRFELADGGTIFLDEIGELPLDVQAKLLRVLQEGEFERVGSSRSQHVDVRVIAATNRNLQDLMREGKFREDLYYRIHVFPINIPPLREREDDVVLLAETFADKFAKKMARNVKPLSSEARMRLKAYHWPGNVRELQNVIERAVITSTDGNLNLERALPDLPREKAELVESSNARVWKKQEMEELERKNLIRALELTGWRISGKDGAAHLLDLKPSTFTSRMKALRIQRPKP